MVASTEENLDACEKIVKKSNVHVIDILEREKRDNILKCRFGEVKPKE